MKLTTAILATIGLASSVVTLPTQASIAYDYTGNLASNGSGSVTASVTFDSTVDGAFTGNVGINHIERWTISSGTLSYTSTAPVDQPDATGYIPLRFEFSSGAIIRWDFDHNPGPGPDGYDLYTMKQSFVVGPGVTEDGFTIGGITNKPGTWAVVPLPASITLFVSGLGGLFAAGKGRSRIGR